MLQSSDVQWVQHQQHTPTRHTQHTAHTHTHTRTPRSIFDHQITLKGLNFIGGLPEHIIKKAHLEAAEVMSCKTGVPARAPVFPYLQSVAPGARCFQAHTHSVHTQARLLPFAVTNATATTQVLSAASA